MRTAEIDLSLHPKQSLALYSDATEILYGGAAGGGKSHLTRVASIIWCTEIPNLQVYIFRRHFDDVIKNHMEGETGFRSMLQPWVDVGLVQITETEVRFKFNGSKIYLCHCQFDADRWKYSGYEMHVLWFEEGVQFSETVIRFLRHRVRMPVQMKDRLPAKYQGKFPRIGITTNPVGGHGRDYLKSAFIDPRLPLAIEKMAKKDGGFKRQFIPAYLDDNPSLDPEEYAGALMGLGTEELVKAMLDGDWSAVLGAYFSNWGDWAKRGGICEPFTLPPTWTLYRSFDWGSARPFSVGWWAMSNGEQPRNGPYVPANALVRYREWYGARAPNEGLEMQPVDVARGILSRQMSGEDRRIVRTHADPACFDTDFGPTVSEEMRKGGVVLSPSDNSRNAGWLQIKNRMDGMDDRPMVYVFNHCRDCIRTMPGLMRDEADWEDIDTKQEDHIADEFRYLCMARPWSKPVPKRQPMRGLQQATYAEILALNDREAKQRYKPVSRFR